MLLLSSCESVAHFRPAVWARYEDYFVAQEMYTCFRVIDVLTQQMYVLMTPQAYTYSLLLVLVDIYAPICSAVEAWNKTKSLLCALSRRVSALADRFAFNHTTFFHHYVSGRPCIWFAKSPVWKRHWQQIRCDTWESGSRQPLTLRATKCRWSARHNSKEVEGMWGI